MRVKTAICRLGSAALVWTAFYVLPTAAQIAAEQRAVASGAVRPGEVLLEASRVYIHVGKSGFGHDHAVVGRLRAGHIKLGAAQAAGQLIFEMASFVADPDYARKFIGLEGVSDPETQGKVTANMLGAEVLDVARYPTAEFRIASASALGVQSQRGLPVYELSGEFTLHGVTKPLRLRTEVQQLDKGTRIMGSFAIRQTDFGMKPFSKGFGVVGVADELKIFGDLHIASNQQGRQEPLPK